MPATVKRMQTFWLCRCSRKYMLFSGAAAKPTVATPLDGVRYWSADRGLIVADGLCPDRISFLIGPGLHLKPWGEPIKVKLTLRPI